MLNKQGPGKIDWTDWTYNPVSGCLHGCSYCFMLRMEKRFPGIMLPKFRPEYINRFLASGKVAPGEKVFVGSSGDMWGEWVEDKWINDVLMVTENRPDVVFQFLTKNPTGYRQWKTDQKNCWYGTSVDGTVRTKRNLFDLIKNTSSANVRFVSFEPLLEPIDNINLKNINLLDWIIIGADSNKGAQKPPKEWADQIIEEAMKYNIPVWVKDNYGYPEIIKEFPKGTL